MTVSLPIDGRRAVAGFAVAAAAPAVSSVSDPTTPVIWTPVGAADRTEKSRRDHCRSVGEQRRTVGVLIAWDSARVLTRSAKSPLLALARCASSSASAHRLGRGRGLGTGLAVPGRGENRRGRPGRTRRPAVPGGRVAAPRSPPAAGWPRSAGIRSSPSSDGCRPGERVESSCRPQRESDRNGGRGAEPFGRAAPSAAQVPDPYRGDRPRRPRRRVPCSRNSSRPGSWALPPERTSRVTRGLPLARGDVGERAADLAEQRPDGLADHLRRLRTLLGAQPDPALERLGLADVGAEPGRDRAR